VAAALETDREHARDATNSNGAVGGLLQGRDHVDDKDTSRTLIGDR
jgi:hypothetical protein